jgi:RNA polymerase sigma-70 factor (ECF subfamily)
VVGRTRLLAYKYSLLKTMETIPANTEARHKLEQHLVAHHDAFLGFVRKRVADPELAADVLQDSLLKALRASDTIRNGENVVAWFYRILRRTIVDLYRRRAIEQRALERIQQEANDLPRPREEAALCRCLDLLLPTLRPGYAELIRELDIEGVDPEWVAERLGITPNNLKVRLHRARGQLRERLLQSCNLCAKHGCLDCDCDDACEQKLRQHGQRR